MNGTTPHKQDYTRRPIPGRPLVVCKHCGINKSFMCDPQQCRPNREKKGPNIQLRGFQHTGLRRLNASPVQRPLVWWATGLGKTVLFSKWLTQDAGDMRPPGIERGLVLAHRDELIEQAVEKLRMIEPGLDIGVVKAERNETWHAVTVASVQTLANLKRLRPLMEMGIRKVVVDEAHHVEAESYQRILAALGCFDPGSGVRTLGVTATPVRADGKALSNTWDECIHKMSIVDGIEQHYLADLKALRVETKADFGKLRASYGDIIASQAEELMMEARAPEDIAHAIHEHAVTKGRKTLCFTPGVASAHETAAQCKRLGMEAAALDGETPTDARRELLRRFHTGQLEVLVNCGVLTEGYDEETIGCVCVARPTMSEGLYVQMVGRGTRLHPGKTDCLLLDVVGVSKRHDLVTFGSIFSGETSDETVGMLDDGASVFQATTAKLGKLEPADLFARRAFAWVKARDAYALSLGGKKEGMLLISQRDNGQWNVWHDRESEGRSIFDGPSLSWAQGAAEEYVKAMGAEILCKRNARWRGNPVTMGQKRMMVVWNVVVSSVTTSGEAADAITRAIAEARLRGRKSA